MFILNTDDEVDGAHDAGVALWRAFNYIVEENDVSQAFVSIVHVSLCTKNNFFRMCSGAFCIDIIIHFNILKVYKNYHGH